MLITGAKVFNVYRKVFEQKAIRVRDGIFVDVDLALVPAAGEEVLDASGLFLVPGLTDIHMHIESSMTTPREFSRAALPRGTTTVVADPHEIANVFGVQGIRCFAAQAAETELDIFFGLPSSVPSTSTELETTGGIIGPDEIRQLASDPAFLCLGEVMNARELSASADSRTRRILAAFREAKPGFPIEGHCPRIQGSELSAFIAAGVWADHTQQTPASILEKIDKGMFIELQKRSVSPENIAVIQEHRLFEHVALVTDDVMPDDLVRGHLDRLLREVIEAGMSPEDAIYCAAYTPCRHIGLRDRGAIAPGRIADFILLDELRSFSVAAVYKRGKKIPSPGAVSARKEAGPGFPAYFYTSVKRRPLEAGDLSPPLPPGFQGDSIFCLTMGLEPHSTYTRRGARSLPASGGSLRWQGQGLCLVAVLERYGHNAPPGFGLAEGMFTKPGAVAASWAHDHHNILVAGTNEADMALAVNAVIAEQGAYVVAADGKIAACAPLPVGGILSEAPIEELGESIRRVREAMIDLGYNHQNVIMSFSTLSLPVSPELKISDKGLIDTAAQKIVSLFETD